MLPYPKFTKLIVSHYMTAFPKISRRAHDRYHNLKDDVMIKNIFNSRKNKTVAGMRIPDWMITEEMKLTKNYQLYAEKSRDKDEARENVEQVKEHLMAEEIEKLVEGSENVAEYVNENVEVSSSPHRNDDIQNVLGTRNLPSPKPIRSPRIHSNLISSYIKKLQELTETDPTPSSSIPSSSLPLHNLSIANRLLSLFKAKPGRFRSYKSFFQELQGRYGYLFAHLLTKFMPRRKFNEVAQRL
nr:hypothetical protein [Tanacetum cinerariifolium]